MATVALTAENFNQYVEKDGDPRRSTGGRPGAAPAGVRPHLRQGFETHADVIFGKVNTEEQPELAGTFEIQAIPTLMVFRDQVLVFARPGVVPAAALDEIIGKVRALDMDDVRKKIAEEEKAEELEQTADGEDPT